MKNKICIYHHLGLGDCIECNGMVRHYAEKYSQVDIFSKSNYYDMVSYMYRDNPSIVVNKIDKNREYLEVSNFLKDYDGEIIIPGHNNYFSNLNFFNQRQMGPAESFYFLANVPFVARGDLFHFERDEESEDRVYEKLNPKNEKFVFVHDDTQRGFEVKVTTNLKIIKNDASENLFHMMKVLENAEEVHCMSSSVLCLIDCVSLKVNFKKLFLHHSVRGIELGPNGLFADWKIL